MVFYALDVQWNGYGFQRVCIIKDLSAQILFITIYLENRFSVTFYVIPAYQAGIQKGSVSFPNGGHNDLLVSGTPIPLIALLTVIKQH